MDAYCVSAAKSFLNIDFPDANAFIILSLDNQLDIDRLPSFLPDDCICVTDIDVWPLRRCLSDAIRFISPVKLSEDIVVPPAAIGLFMDGLARIKQDTGLTLLGYGHLGDGNIHVNVLKESINDNKWKHASANAVLAVFNLTISLGGSITGEHGIGLSKKSFLPLMFDNVHLQFMKSVKSTFDPNYILNPHKIF